MADISDDLLEEALNSISNAESSKPKNFINDSKRSEDQIQAILDNMDESFSEDILKNLSEINVGETNDLIESVLGELMSKDILYEPFQCMKKKIEEEIKSGNKKNEKGLDLINSILKIFDEQNDKSKNANKEKLMQLIYELQEQGDLWQALSNEN